MTLFFHAPDQVLIQLQIQVSILVPMLVKRRLT